MVYIIKWTPPMDGDVGFKQYLNVTKGHYYTDRKMATGFASFTGARKMLFDEIGLQADGTCWGLECHWGERQ